MAERTVSPIRQGQGLVEEVEEASVCVLFPTPPSSHQVLMNQVPCMMMHLDALAGVSVMLDRHHVVMMEIQHVVMKE